jgi:hypothetical protein
MSSKRLPTHSQSGGADAAGASPDQSSQHPPGGYRRGRFEIHYLDRMDLIRRMQQDVAVLLVPERPR